MGYGQRTLCSELSIMLANVADWEGCIAHLVRQADDTGDWANKGESQIVAGIL